MANIVRAALVQTAWTGEKESMVEKHVEYAREAAEQGAQVMCFQEMFNSPYFCQVQEDEHKDTAEPAKVIKHVEWYAEYFSTITGRKSTPEDLITISEAVYNFQRIFNLRMGFGRRQHDTLPYRAVGPVTEDEYLSRQDRYDKQLTEKYSVDIADMETAEKIAVLRKHREEEYEKLADAVYQRRGWTEDGVPTLSTVSRLGIDFPEVLGVLKANGIS